MGISYDPTTAPRNGDSTAANNRGSSRIIHFDATMVRKDKMRAKALSPTGNGASARPSTAATAGLAPTSPTTDSRDPETPHLAETGHRSDMNTAPPPAPSHESPTVAQRPESVDTGSSSGTKSSAPPPEQLESFLISFVVEQTGYPAEIVELDADLEADLAAPTDLPDPRQARQYVVPPTMPRHRRFPIHNR